MNRSYLAGFLLLISTIGNAGDFRFRIAEDLGSLDWTQGEVAPMVILQLMEGLTTSGPKGEPTAALASGWRSKLSGKTYSYEFRIRSEAKWSDGEPVCAQHFIDGWMRVISAKLASPYAHYLFDIKNAEAFHSGKAQARDVGLKSAGCKVLQVLMERPVAYFPALVSHWVFFPFRKDLFERHGQKWSEPGSLAVTGPYLLEAWEKDRKYVFRKNPRYYGSSRIGGAPERLIALAVWEDVTALALFEKGELDWIKDLPFADKPRLSKRADYRLFPSFVEYHLGFRFGRTDVLSREQRCALAASLDKAEIPKLLQGGEAPGESFVAKSLGGRRGKGLARPPMKGVRFPGSEIELYFYAKDVHVPLMEWIQQEWKKKLGLTVKLVRLESKSYWSRLYRDPPMVFLSGTTAAYPHAYSFLSELLSGSRANWGRYESGKYDAAARKAAVSNQPWKAVREAETIALDEDCAIIPLYFRQTSSLVSDRWRGFWINPMAYAYLKELRLKKP